MCVVYKHVGSLTALTEELKRNGILEFRTLDDILKFQKSYMSEREEILEFHSRRIDLERIELEQKLSRFDTFVAEERVRIDSNFRPAIEFLKQDLERIKSIRRNGFFTGIGKTCKTALLRIRIWLYWKQMKKDERKSIHILEHSRAKNQRRLDFIITRFQDAVTESAHWSLHEIDNKKSVVDRINSSVLGAIGELKVVRELENLSDDYSLINDFSVDLKPAIYYRQQNSYIKSIQIDHVLVGPAGVFLIETKNWSAQSVNNAEMRSPIMQVQRTSYALFMLLNREQQGNRYGLEHHHWGKKRISVRNLVVMINAKPSEQFQFVKILSLNELLPYLRYLPAIYTSGEVEAIKNSLLRFVHV